MTIQLLLDAVLVALALALLGYGVRFSRRLEVFRQARVDMAAVLGQLNQSVARAERAITDLRDGIAQVETGLGGRHAEARRLVDELALMTEAGESLARRLEAAGRHKAPASVKPTGIEAAPRIIRGGAREKGHPTASAPAPTALSRQIAALEAMRRKAAA